MRLPDVFQYIRQSWSSIEGRLRAEQFKVKTTSSVFLVSLRSSFFSQQKVMSSFRAWESWAIYPSDFLIKLQHIFLGLVKPKNPPVEILLRSNERN